MPCQPVNLNDLASKMTLHDRGKIRTGVAELKEILRLALIALSDLDAETLLATVNHQRQLEKNRNKREAESKKSKPHKFY